MAKIGFHGHIDLKKQEVQNVALQTLSNHPLSPVEGQVYYNQVYKTFYGWNGEEWLDLARKRFKGIFGDLSGAPTGKKEGDVVAIETEYGLLPYIWDGDNWKHTYDLKTYIDKQVQWGTKEF